MIQFTKLIQKSNKLLKNTKRDFSIYNPLINLDVQKIQSKRLITAIKTPYLKNGKIDLKSFDQHAELQIKHGVEGFIIGGTTGEGHLFTWDEHIMLIAHAKNNFGDKCIIIGNTGSNSTREALHATEQGFDVGMDASLQINPYYGKTSENGILKHLRSTLDLGPAIIYNVPGRTSQDISFNIMHELSSHYNFVGVKECMGAERIQEYSNNNIITWSGNDDECHDTRHYNDCNGVISVTSNVIPGLFKKLMDEENRELNLKLQKLIKLLFIEPNPIGINTLMMMLGICQPNFRLPYVELDENLRKELIQVVEDIGIEHFLSNNGTCKILEKKDFFHIR